MGSGSGGDWQRYFRTGSDLIERASAPTVDEDVGLPGTNRGEPASFLTHSNTVNDRFSGKNVHNLFVL